jgi:hypothetical protein
MVLDAGTARYHPSYGNRECVDCALLLPDPWETPCPLCGGEVGREHYRPYQPARVAWLQARAGALKRLSRGEPLTDEDRYHIDRRGYLATLAGARPPGVPAPAPVADSYGGGMHCKVLDIRHPDYRRQGD